MLHFTVVKLIFMIISNKLLCKNVTRRYLNCECGFYENDYDVSKGRSQKSASFGGLTKNWTGGQG